MEQPHLYQRLSPGPGRYRHETVNQNEDEEEEEARPFFGNRRIKYGDILTFLNTVLLAVIVIVILLAVFVISSHRGVLSDLGARMETVEDLARNVNDASNVLRRALGERGIDDPEDGGRGVVPGKSSKNQNKHGDNSRWRRWLEDRGPDEEAMITDHAATALVRGIRSLVRIMEQVDQIRLPVVMGMAMTHVDEMLAGPEAGHIMHAIDAAVQHPQAKLVVEQGMDLLAHAQGAILPLFDAIMAELKIQIEAMMAAGDPGLTAARFQALVRQWMELGQKLAGGLGAAIDWYRQGGPSDAAMLASDLISALREFIESPAGRSMINVLESIDWKQTGDQVSDAAHNAAQIMRTINQAQTIGAGDRLIRAAATLLEDPGTRRVIDLLPAVVANATAVLSTPKAQQLIESGSLLMSRMDTVLSQAEQAHTVESASTFMQTLRVLLGALLDAGLHLEVGSPASPRLAPERTHHQQQLAGGDHA